MERAMTEATVKKMRQGWHIWIEWGGAEDDWDKDRKETDKYGITTSETKRLGKRLCKKRREVCSAVEPLVSSK